MQHKLRAILDLARQRPWASLCLAGLLVLAAILIGSGVRLATSQDQRAGVVVQFGDGSMQTACVNLQSADSNRDGKTTGEEVLRAAGFDVIAEVSALGPAICKVGPDGCNFPQEHCFCECSLAPGSDCRYWAYSRLEGGVWRTSGLGAGNTQVQPGDVEGWVWGYGTVNQGAQPPLYSFDDICMLEAATPSSTASATPSATLTASATNTPTPTYTALPSNTPLPTFTALPSFTPPPSPTNQPSPSQTSLPDVQATPTSSPSPTAQQVAIREISRFYIYLPHLIHIVKVQQPEATPEASTEPEATPEASAEPEATPEAMPSSTASPSPTASATATPLPSPSASPTAQASPTAARELATATASASATATQQLSVQATSPASPTAPSVIQAQTETEASFGPYLGFVAILVGLIGFWLFIRQGST